MERLVYMVHTKLCHRPFGARQSLSVHAKRLPAIMVLAAIFILALALPAMAVPRDDPLTVINNLSSFIFSLIRAVGLILLGFGILQVGMSIQSHGASQRTQGFLCPFGGLMIAFAKEILSTIGAI